ncbi:D-alanine--D-alanine ligase [Patescibacteria group bacterium]|nr:D-alanine--D-alanine ligase [Patescibacteria group bacterium]MBU1921608.1 D-alanine--D-alanine ligase [Patescibacteria group bacterium]
MAKIRVAVILGGTSSEREVSLNTGENVIKNLAKHKYDVSKYDPKDDLNRLLSDAQDKKFDIAFIALHGRGGEDGTIQGLLELAKVPYIGSGVMSSAIAMNKLMSKVLFRAVRIPSPKHIAICRAEFQKEKLKLLQNIEKKLGFPCVIKPNSSGSSVAVSICKDGAGLEKDIVNAFLEDELVLVEKYIRGQEITVPILGQEALPVIEICPKRDFFDLKAKYDSELCDEIVPARLSSKITARAQCLGLKAHRVMWCKDYSRVDMIVSQDGNIFVLEVNSLPGFTKESLFPKSAKSAGIEFTDLLDKLVQLGLKI